MLEQKVTIMNKAGIHCRPSGVIMDRRKDFPGTRFEVAAPSGDNIELESILDLIALGLKYGETVTLRVSGADEKNAMTEISKLFSTVYDFPPRTAEASK